MSWRENLREASFRGVPFYVREARSTVGRRTVVHEFPGRDLPYVADMGRKGSRFRLEAIVIGDGYMNDRDDLLVALRDVPGPGTLVHPFWGEFQAVPDGEVEITESTEEGGMARVSVTMVEASAVPPQPDADTAGDLLAAAAAFEAALADDFVAGFSVLGALVDAINEAQAMVNAALAAVRAVKNTVASVLNAIDTLESSISELADAVADIINLPGQLAAAVVGLYRNVLSAIGRVVDAAGNLLDIFGTSEDGQAAGAEAKSPAETQSTFRRDRAQVLSTQLERFSSYGDDFEPIAAGTPDSAQRAANQDAMKRLVKGAAALAVAETAAQIEYVNQTTAMQLLEVLDGMLEDVAATASDGLYAATADLRVALADHLREATAGLPRLSTYTPDAATPSLVIAYSLYGDVAREAELLRLNPGIRHPGFVPAGEPLTVVTDE